VHTVCAPVAQSTTHAEDYRGQISWQGQGQPQPSQPGGLGSGGDQQSVQGGADGGGGVSLPPGHPNYDQMQRFYQQQAASRASAGAATGGPASDPKPGVGAPGQPDRFGLLGLLSVIRMTDPDLTTLVRLGVSPDAGVSACT
jgi:hypothetical protein